ncbi:MULTISPECIES: YfhO family protein [unclassified Myroides]|uniref:YfhO family protein n=1 Tax=unclassified Myroides TaxID=2642485 RepID=UPI003D2F52A2
MKKVYRYFPHILAFFGFMLIALLYFSPVMEVKTIYQSDIAQYIGMSSTQKDYSLEEGVELYWTDNSFLGMPTYQLGADYPYNYIKELDRTIRFLPRPADYLVLYLLSFYVLLLTLRVKPLKAFFGALAFGFSTYLIIIFGAGHNAKAHAIAYMPLVLSGIILVFQKHYFLGGVLTTLAVALEIQANHFQMTYYLLFVLFFLGVYYTIQIAKEQDYKHLFRSIGILVVAAVLALGANATSLLATAEFSQFTIRHKSELTFNPDGSTNDTQSAMNYDYITEYSYGIGESLNLIFPRLFGGGMAEDVGENSVLYQYAINQGALPSDARDFVSKVPLYWGDQPIVEAPAYIGAIVFFLAVLCLLADKRKIKYVFIASIVVTLFLSWGKNFPWLTNFFIDYVPLYDKFRAVSSIQVIVELCMPILAIMGLQTYFQLDEKEQKRYLLQSGGIFFALVVVLWLGKQGFSFTSYRDQMYMQTEQGRVFLMQLVKERQRVYTADLWRSSLYVGAVIVALFLTAKKYIPAVVATVIVGSFMVADLVLIDRNYVNDDNFVSSYEMSVPFQMSQADEYILQDKGHYRVYNPQGRLQARTNFFHKSVGGYSAVRPQKADQVFLYQVEPQLHTLLNHIDLETLTLEKSLPVLDMLNVKYLILETEDREEVPIVNPRANGSAWFVQAVKVVETADEEMKALTTLDVKREAVVNGSKFAELAKQTDYVVDSTATIKLIGNRPDHLQYEVNNQQQGFAVFSEVYYSKGWNAYLDHQLVPHYEVNYLLRGLPIPAGQHKLEFKFEPEVIQRGTTITLLTLAVGLLLFGLAILYQYKKSKK